MYVNMVLVSYAEGLTRVCQHTILHTIEKKIHMRTTEARKVKTGVLYVIHTRQLKK